MPCYVFEGRNGAEAKFRLFVCATNPNWAFSVISGGKSYSRPRDGTTYLMDSSYLLQPDRITYIATQAIYNTTYAQAGYYLSGSCSGCQNQSNTTTYDCINGNCVTKGTYNTPGIHASLAACQAVCGAPTNSCNAPNICVSPDYCPPGMVCIPSAKLGQVEGLASDIKNKSC